MKVWVFEDNLMWSVRLVRAIRALEHEATVLSGLPAEGESADVAIVNLGSVALPGAELGASLVERGLYVIAHAGHKETPLLAEGKQAGCHRVATNRETTHRLGDLLAEAARWLADRPSGTISRPPA